MTRQHQLVSILLSAAGLLLMTSCQSVSNNQIHTPTQGSTNKASAPADQSGVSVSKLTAPRESKANAVLSVGQTAAAPKVDRPNLRKKLMPLLFGYEYVPKKNDFAGLASTDALVRTLIDIHRDETVHLHPRTQALACLRFFPVPEVKAIYEKTLTDPSVRSLFRRPIIIAYAASFGGDAFETVRKLLNHTDMHTRTLAVKALAQIKSPETINALKMHLKTEKAPKVIRTLKTQLKALGQ